MTDADATTWDALAARSPRGEALQSHAWGELKAAGGWRVIRVRIELDGTPVAVASVQERDLAEPVLRRLGGLGRRVAGPVGGLGRFLYAPLGPVLLRDPVRAGGGPTDAGETRAGGADVVAVDGAAALRGLRQLARRRHAALLVVDPVWAVDTDLAATLPASGFTRAERAVQVSTTAMHVPLHDDEGSQWRQLNQNARRNVERCRKAGVDVVRYDAGSDDAALREALAASYRMLAETGRRRGFGDVLRPETYHDQAALALIRSGNASLWIARHEDRDLAYTLVHHSGDRAVLFEAGEADLPAEPVPEPGPVATAGSEDAATDAGSEVKATGPRFAANFLLQWTIIRWAAEAGFATYDMSGVDNHQAPGLPRDESHPLWSLFRFKSQWGAQPIQLVGAWEHAPWPVLGRAFRAARGR
ncbi:MAG: GNAT family N-acetyltransferase [Chloroflexi bacterium]|nr:GNAT family N-acetyltransferase [Chloroflexota bacterium]